MLINILSMLILMLFYISSTIAFCIGLYGLCKKMNTSNPELALFPIINLFSFTKIVEEIDKTSSYKYKVFISFISSIFFGIMSIIGFTNMYILTILAFSLLVLFWQLWQGFAIINNEFINDGFFVNWAAFLSPVIPVSGFYWIYYNYLNKEKNK